MHFARKFLRRFAGPAGDGSDNPPPGFLSRPDDFPDKPFMKAGDAALAAMSGVLLLLAFPRFNLEVLAWGALVPLLYSLRGKGARSAFLLGWICGLVFFLGQLYWVASTMKVYGQVPATASTLTMLALVAYLSFYIALFASLMRLWGEHRGAWGWLFVPLLWTSLEFVRENASFLGFPWGSLGYSQFMNLKLIQVADITGVPGVTFIVALVNSAAAHIIFRLTSGRGETPRRGRDILFPAAAAIAVLAAIYIYGGWRLARVEDSIADAESLRVALVQGNIAQDRKWEEDNIPGTVRKYGRLTIQASARDPRLIVWPETAVPFFFQIEGKGREEVLRIARRNGAYLLFGGPSSDYEEGGVKFYNSAFMVSPGGEQTGRYDKRRLVPFGEYVPWKWLFSFVNKIVEGEGEFSMGEEGKLLVGAGIPLGVLICFEILFPNLARKQAGRGARLLVNITNDAWFGRTSAPYQHFSIGVFRAIENRMTLARAANTGISGFIAPSGRVLDSTDIFNDGWLVEDVALTRGPPTFYTRFGAVFAWSVVSFTILTLFLSWNARRVATRGWGGKSNVEDSNVR